MMKKGVAALFVVVLMAALAHETAVAVECDPMSLQSCFPAIAFGTTPTAGCCSGLKEQQPCFCQYISDPTYGSYVNSPNAQKAAKYCGIVIPTNC